MLCFFVIAQVSFADASICPTGNIVCDSKPKEKPGPAKPTAHTTEELARFRKRRREARIRHVACHALYLVNLASRDGEIRSKSFDALGATLETARSIRADGTPSAGSLVPVPEVPCGDGASASDPAFGVRQ